MAFFRRISKWRWLFSLIAMAILGLLIWWFGPLLHYLDGEKRYILAPSDLKVGDAVFGVRSGLVLPFKKEKDRRKLPKNLVALDKLPMPVWTATLDLKLPPPKR